MAAYRNKPLSRSHSPFARSPRLGPGPRGGRLEEKRDWKCKKQKGKKYVQICKYIGIDPRMKGKTKKWRQSFLCEYWSEGAWPWIVGMGYKAVRTEKYKYIHWTHHQGMAEMYDLEKDPYEMNNLAADPSVAKEREAVKKELRKLTAEALGI